MEALKQKTAEENPLVKAREEVIAEFSDTSYRLEWVKNQNGVDFVNDAKASNVYMSIEAIEQCTHQVIWIVDGTDWVQQFNSIKDILKEKVKAIIYLNEEPCENLIQSVSGLVQSTLRLHTIEEAVQASLSYAEEGDCVMFSPAAPGYQKLETYRKRGELFNQSVAKL